MLRTLSAVLLATCAALLVACEDDDTSTARTATPEASEATPDIRSSAPGGAASAPAIAPPATGVAVTAGGAQPAGLTVRQPASATVPAERAFATMLLPVSPSRMGPTGPQPIPTKDRDNVIAALGALGIPREAITIEANLQYGPFTELRIELPIADLPAKGQQAIDAAERVLGRAQSTGASFGVRDCARAIEPLRKQAVAGAGEQARALASLAGVTLGPIIAIAEQVPQSPYGPPAADPCSSASPAPPKATVARLALDAKPEVKLSLELVVTYRLGERASGLSIAGSGRATAAANEAYVVILIEPIYGPTGPRAVEARDRAAFIDRLRALGITADAITIESSTFGGPTVVSVDVPVDRLPKIGEDIVDAASRTVGRALSQGVQFTHRDCAAVRTEARKQALADARTRATALAAAAGLKLGAPVAIAAASFATPVLDPCDVQPAALALGGPYGGALKPFDADPEFTVDAALAVTYALE